jgi:hypothetical protein
MKLDTADLRSTSRLLALRHELAPDLDTETLVALAERALADGRKPGALFQWMLSHPESWDWLRENDRAKARKRLRTVAEPRRSYFDSTLPGLKRHAGACIGRKRYSSTGWELEAAAKWKAFEDRVRRRARRERWETLVGVAAVAFAVLWLFL